jgi:hypothetical protein
MTSAQRTIVENIRKHGSVCMVTPHGVYSRFGNFIGFVNSGKHSTSTRDQFLKKFCTKFTPQEREKIKHQHTRNLTRYQKLAIQCLNNSNFEKAAKLCESAAFLANSMDEKNYYRLYFHLKEGI